MDSRENPKRTIKLRSRVIPALVLLLIGVQLFFPDKGWMMLLSGLGGAWLISYLWARSLKDGLRLERDMRFGWMQVGDQLQERVTVANDGWAPGLWVRIIDQSNMHDYEISGVKDVSSWKYRHWFTRGICTRRGLYTLGPTSLEAGDPLGVYNVRVDYSDSANMMVAPQVISLPEIEIAAGGRIGEGRSHVRGMEQTVTAGGVREYVPGDSLRWIHWPTTARKDEPYVHLFDNEPSSDWWVVLDMDPGVHVGEGQRSTEEYGVILAASLINHGLQMGKAVGFIGYGNDPLWHAPDLGDTHLWKILRSLASVRPGGPPLVELLDKIRNSLGQNISLVVITPNLSPEWLNALEFMQRGGIVPTVILMDPNSFGGSGNIHALRDRLIQLGVAHYTITADLLDPPETPSVKPWEWWFVSTGPDASSEAERKPFWQKLFRTIRTWGLIFLIFVGMVSALGDSVRGVEENFLWFMVASGLFISWLLTSIPLPGWIFGLVSGGVGIALTLSRVGRLGNELYIVSSQFLTFIYHNVLWLVQNGNRPEAQLLQSNLGELWEKITLLGTRLWMWLSGVIQGEPFFDPVPVAFLWGILVWGSAAWAMWGVFRRRKPILGGLPAILLVVISLIYTQEISYNVVLMLGSMIALTVFVRHDSRERLWEDSRLYYDTTIRPKIMIVAIFMALGLMMISIISPSISISSIEDFIHDLWSSQSDNPDIARSFGLKSQPNPVDLDVLDSRRSGSLPNRHLLGTGPELSDQVVMLVRLEAWQGEESVDAVSQFPLHLYIRNLTYDQYTGQGWISRDTDILDYDAGVQILTSWPDNYRLVRQQIQVVEDLGGLMYAVGIPVSADHDFRIAWRLNNVENGEFDIFGGTIGRENYRVDSITPTYSEAELRKVGQDYPGWLRERYMSLPSLVPDEVLSLARDLTATEPTPYDRAVALERYLRQFPYTLDVTMPPAGQDVTEYFLFTLQKGYCDYYATAMAVLARAAGLPSRLVIGYIAENYDDAREAYVIAADQAHAWTEVYFPEYGWIPFEPTAGRSAVQRLSEPLTELPEEIPSSFEPLVPSRSISPQRWLKAIGIIILVVVGSVVVWWKVSDWWLIYIPEDKLVLKLYARLYRYGRWIGIPTRPGETPYEFAEDLIHHIQSLSSNSHWSDWLLIGVDEMKRITEAHVILMFNPLRRSLVNGKEIIRAYKSLRPRLWLLWLLKRAYNHPITCFLFWRATPVLTISVPGDES
jgi:uncharacterized protein (DUF58 family)/transglutaminase-like putative cysteine protease